MTHTNEMRPLSAMEIDFVAGAGEKSPPPPFSGDISVTQSNQGSSDATGKHAGGSVSITKQKNVSVIIVDSPVFAHV